MGEWWISTTVGVTLLAGGIVMVRSHRAVWRRQKSDTELDHLDRTHFYSRYRRRMQTSGMLGVIGFLIPVGDLLINRKIPPIGATLFWMGVLLLVLWVILLGFGDLLATRTHARIALARVRQKQEELQRQLAEFRNRKSSNRNGRRR